MSKSTPKTAAEKSRDRILRELAPLAEEARLAVLAEACRQHGYMTEAKAFYTRLADEMEDGLDAALAKGGA